ncbi:hypothetical protein NHE_0241 [Neorickettsia helminthoeca str. Oregon]|uniref:Uncharacterized protein n=1 Tax=Neorickettsia helminthoeca str. Oregon TaxID=1286528 RepID=X5H3C4_9RICK|nr:hypothetical protein NHE_0241 [Neorickettsia helminthoeca str. Oregon]
MSRQDAEQHIVFSNDQLNILCFSLEKSKRFLPKIHKVI